MKIKPYQISLISIFATVFKFIIDNMGLEASTGRRYSGMGGLNLLLPIIALLLPVFKKELRKEYWSKTNILILVLAIIINLPFTIIYEMNRLA